MTRQTACNRILKVWILGCAFLALLPEPVPGAGPGPETPEPRLEQGAESGEMPESAAGGEQIPLEWIEEILENQEALESLEMLEKYELFNRKSRFSPHHFD